MRKIPLVDLKAQYEEVKKEIWEGWEKAFETMHLMLGPNIEAFEKEFAAYCGSKFGVGVDSGTNAVYFALKALGINEDHEVITVSHTFFATVEAILYTGAYPRFVDIKEDSYTIDPDAVKEFINTKCEYNNGKLIDKETGREIKAILPVHLYGNPADMDEILKIAQKYNLFVVEDAAQAHGAEFKGRKVGSFGETAGFSFYMSKNLSALGEAGIVLTDKEEYAEILKLYRVHGQIDKYTHKFVGYNARLDEIQAIVLRAKLKKLDEWNEKRIKLANYYNEKLKDIPVVLPKIEKDKKHVFHLYVIRTKSRDQLFNYLRENGVGAGIHYPIPCHLQPAIEELGYKEGDLPVTEKVAKEVLSLPMYPHLKKEDVDYIVDKIKDFFSK